MSGVIRRLLSARDRRRQSRRGDQGEAGQPHPLMPAAEMLQQIQVGLAEVTDALRQLEHRRATIDERILELETQAARAEDAGMSAVIPALLRRRDSALAARAANEDQLNATIAVADRLAAGIRRLTNDGTVPMTPTAGDLSAPAVGDRHGDSHESRESVRGAGHSVATPGSPAATEKPIGRTQRRPRLVPAFLVLALLSVAVVTVASVAQGRQRASSTAILVSIGTPTAITGTAPPGTTLALSTPTGIEPVVNGAESPTTGRVPPPAAAPAATPRVEAIAAVVALESGQFVTTIDYGNGSQSVVRGTFDLGRRRSPRRLQFSMIYSSITGRRTEERIAIGDRAWQRTQMGQWQVTPTQDGLFEQLQGYLPPTDIPATATSSARGEDTEFSWTAAAQDSEYTLIVNSSTHIPLQFDLQTRTSGVRVRVEYTGWNTPVEIDQPQLP